MDKDQVAAALTEIGTLLEIQGENAFRCNAYHNGALGKEKGTRTVFLDAVVWRWGRRQ